MERANDKPSPDAIIAHDKAARLAKESHAVRIARLRRDRALTPAQRLDKLAALCRQAELLRGARRLP
jgi:hypothetical protein